MNSMPAPATEPKAAAAFSADGFEYIATNFENASPLWYEIGDNGAIQVHLLYDHERSSSNRAAGHFHFQVQAAPGSKLAIEFRNLNNVWNGRPSWVGKAFRKAMISEDGRSWRPVALEIAPNELARLTIEMPGPRLFVARVEPYRLSDLDRLLDEIAAHPQVHIAPIGKTFEGRTLEIVRIGDPSASHRVFLRARSHPWESGTNWVVQGLIRRLLEDDDDAKAFRARYCAYIMPMANKDGVARGATRFNLQGKDLNRNWGEPADAALAPENHALEAWLEEAIRVGKPPDLAIDLHNDAGGLLHFSHLPIAN
ncbi:MAG TPA: M14 family zinc carboxypeptidase, partial [Candidatus Hydrogenedentes bacterium]|nr:M14 family zinc carboxypeptidase [Candidatus Hydrogenedentota bacterium]